MASREREIAFNILMDIEKRGAFSGIAIANALKNNRGIDAGFVRNLSYGVIEQKLLLDYFISQLVKDGGKRLRLPERTILRMGLYQLRAMDAVPEYAAIDESVELAKEFARGKDGLVNAVLRNYLRKGEPALPEGGDVDRLSIQYSCGRDIVSQWIDDMGVTETEAMLKAVNRRPPIVIRTNLTKTTREDLRRELSSEGFELINGELSETALIVDARKTDEDITETEAFKRGHFSVQDEASQWLVSMVDPEPGEIIIDVCAAPGGKTLALAEKLKSLDNGADSGIIQARDISSQKLQHLGREAKRLGVSDAVNISVADAKIADESAFGRYDKVVADLPCSGLGVLSRRPEMKYNKTEKDFIALSEVQVDILNNVSKFVKPGGLLIYSTCTINSLENQAVVKEFLNSHKEFTKKWERQLLPTKEGCDGFFAAALGKETNVKSRI